MDILDRVETPCYVIHKEELDRGLQELKEALRQHWGNAVIGYSFKTNALPWVLSYMRGAGCYAEVVSEDEYRLAEYARYDKVIYNGPVKGKESFFDALDKGYIVNLDAKRELRWLAEYAERGRAEQDGSTAAPAAAGRPVKVGIRVNFDLEAACPGEASGGPEGGRFGFSYESGELREAVERLKGLKGVCLAGIHLHCSSKTRSLNIYRAIARMACRVKKEMNLELSYVDVGGGYFGGMKDKPRFGDYVACMGGELRQEFTPEETALIVEPGTSLITPPVDYVSAVVDVRRTGRNCFVTTDGSRIDVDPLMTKKSYFHEIQRVREKASGQEGLSGREIIPRQVISGFTCMENDRLFVLEEEEALREGDKIIYHKVGGYTMCLTPLFIHYFPAVYLEDKGALEVVREHWTYAQYVQNSRL